MNRTSVRMVIMRKRLVKRGSYYKYSGTKDDSLCKRAIRFEFSGNVRPN